MWRTVKLGDVLELQNGYAFKSKEYTSDGYFVMRITNVQQGYISTHNPKYIQIDLSSKLTKFILEEGDILVSLTGDVGRVGVIREEHLPAALNQRVARVQSIDASVDDEFLFHYLNSQIFRNQVEALGRGAAQANVSTKDILELAIELPPLAEQKRIVAKLDAAFAEIDKAILLIRNALDTGSHLRKKTFEALFEKTGEQYGVMQLGDGIELISGQHIAAKDYNSDGVGVGYLTGPSDFGNINPVVTKFTTYPKKTAQRGDVLVTIKGSGIGKANIMVEQELAISRQLAAIRPVAFTSEFVFEFIKTQFETLQNLGNGAAIPGLSRADIENLEIPSPPLDLQGEILEQVMSSDSQIERYEQCQIEKLQNFYQLKSAILAQELQPSEAV